MKLLVTIFVFALFESSSSHALVTGNELLSNCTKALSVIKDPLSSAQNSKSDAFDTASCISYIEGAVDGIVVADRLVEDRSIFCRPKGVNNGQLVRVVVKYLEENPESLHEWQFNLVLKALIEAFPCNKKEEQD